MASINPISTQQAPTLAQQQSLPMTALASPYDGTNPAGGVPVTGVPVGGVPGGFGGQVPQLTGLAGAGGHPQVNATNQTAIAPGGTVNQTVSNENTYSNRYYNIVVPNGGLFGGIGGGIGGVGGLLGSWNTPGNSFIDPKTGVLYVQQDHGITGWFKRLFRGY
jgi:hypothetical protein